MSILAFSVLPCPLPSEVVAFSVLPEPAPGEVVRISVLPDPRKTEVVGFSVLPPPLPQRVVGLSMLREPVLTEVVGLSVLPAPLPSQVVASTVLPPPTPVVDERLESLPAVAPDVALAPRELSSPPAPRPSTQRGPAAPRRPRRFRVGVVAVVLGALGVVAVREFVGGGDEEDVGSAVEPPGAVPQASTAGDATPAAGQPAAEQPAAPAPTVASSAPPSATEVAPIDPATATPETIISLVPTPPANTAPAAGVTQFSGFGNFVIDLTGHDLSRKIMVVTHNGVAGFELSTLDQDLIQLALVESVVGSVAGTYPLGVEGEVTPSYLRIDADGDWTIDIKSVDEARLWQADFITGTGADVLRYEGGASVLDYTNAGSSNFIVQYHRNPGFDLLVNEIGPISGTTTMQAGPGVVVVDAVGDWALSARPS